MKLDDEIQTKPMTDIDPQAGGRGLSPSFDSLPLIDIPPKVPEVSISMFDRVALWAHETKEAGKFYGALAMFVFRVYAVVKANSEQTKEGIVFKDWKTTLVGVVGACAVLVKSIFGIDIPSDAILGVAVFLVGLFAKDSKTK